MYLGQIEQEQECQERYCRAIDKSLGPILFTEMTVVSLLLRREHHGFCQFANIITDYLPHWGQLSVCPDVPGDHVVIEGGLAVLVGQAVIIPRVLSPGHTRIALSGDWMVILMIVMICVPGVVGPGPGLVPVSLSLRHKSVRV